MGTTVITIRNVDNVPEGSVFDAELEKDGDKLYWTGLWSSMWGSHTISIPVENCEVYNEQLHDPLMWLAKQHFERKRLKRNEENERAELAQLKEKARLRRCSE